MLVGKRPREPIMRRTASMSGGLANEEVDVDVDVDVDVVGMAMAMGTPAPLINHNHTTTNTTCHFLRTCGLCSSHLAPGRDIFMYRGDTAFCSLECREKQMKQDQRKDKWKNHHCARASPPAKAAAT